MTDTLVNPASLPDSPDAAPTNNFGAAYGRKPAGGGYGAYKQTQQQGEDYRVTEAQALLRCAGLLEEAQKADVSYMDYAAAVRHNQELWTLFQAALVEPDNPLPPHLKDTLKGLSIYIDRRTLRALADHKAELLNILITINKEIAAGLMESYKNSMKSDGASGSQTGGNEGPPPNTPRINTKIL